MGAFMVRRREDIVFPPPEGVLGPDIVGAMFGWSILRRDQNVVNSGYDRWAGNEP